jgi:hypothetical protein
VPPWHSRGAWAGRHVACAAIGGRYGGNAFMNAGAYPMLNDLFRTPHDRSDYYARLTSVAGVGAMIGPIAGSSLFARGQVVSQRRPPARGLCILGADTGGP